MYRKNITRKTDYEQLRYKDLDEEELSVLCSYFVSSLYSTTAPNNTADFIFEWMHSNTHYEYSIMWGGAAEILFEYNEYMKNNNLKLIVDEVKIIVPRKSLVDFI